ncbi:beta-galactosidase small subunit-related protein [Streptomyces diastatochromogenes]
MPPVCRRAAAVEQAQFRQDEGSGTHEWFGVGPFESYPGSLRAARTGRFSSTVRDLSVDYARPQETGHRSRLRWLTLASGDTEVLRIDAIPDTRGRRPGFTLSRHTPQQIVQAAHPCELPDSTTSHLIIDAAQPWLTPRRREAPW